MKNKLFHSLTFLVLCALMLCMASCGAATNKGDVDNGYIEMLPGEKPEMGVQNGDLTLDSITDPNRKIIKTYNLNAETKEFDTVLTELLALINEHGGYVEQNSISNHTYNTRGERYANYTIRIPAEKAEDFVGSIGNLLNVTRNSSTVEDVSETYYSIEAVLEELEAERDSLLAMMESLNSKEDYNFWLTLQQRLSEIKQEIAVYQAQLKNYDSKVAYSTIDLSINEVVEYTPDARPDFLARLGDAFVGGWTAFAECLQGIAIALVAVFPFLLIPAGVAVVVVILVRRARMKK